MTHRPDPYGVLDPILGPWAKRHGIRISKADRDVPVRSIWVYDKSGNPRAQLWVDVPDAQGNVTIVASALVSASCRLSKNLGPLVRDNHLFTFEKGNLVPIGLGMESCSDLSPLIELKPR